MICFSVVVSVDLLLFQRATSRESSKSYWILLASHNCIDQIMNNEESNSRISAKSCLNLLRAKCKRQVNIAMKVSKEQKSKAGYSAVTSVGTLLQSPTSETRAEEVAYLNGKNVLKRVFLKNSRYSVGWIMDSETSSCMSCETAFGLFVRKHHCRQCGEIVCYSCSNQRLHLPSLEEAGGSRVCTRCMDRLYQDALERRQKLNRKVYFAGIPSGSLFESSVLLEQAPVEKIAPVLAHKKSSPVETVEQKGDPQLTDLSTNAAPFLIQTPEQTKISSLHVSTSVEDKMHEALLNGNIYSRKSVHLSRSITHQNTYRNMGGIREWWIN